MDWSAEACELIYSPGIILGRREGGSGGQGLFLFSNTTTQHRHTTGRIFIVDQHEEQVSYNQEGEEMAQHVGINLFYYIFP